MSLRSTIERFRRGSEPSRQEAEQGQAQQPSVERHLVLGSSTLSAEELHSRLRSLPESPCFGPGFGQHPGFSRPKEPALPSTADTSGSGD